MIVLYSNSVTKTHIDRNMEALVWFDLGSFTILHLSAYTYSLPWTLIRYQANHCNATQQSAPLFLFLLRSSFWLGGFTYLLIRSICRQGKTLMFGMPFMSLVSARNVWLQLHVAKESQSQVCPKYSSVYSNLAIGIKRGLQLSWQDTMPWTHTAWLILG